VRARCRRDGFTLIELMVTMAIIAVAMTAVIPALQQAMRDRRLQQEAVDFMAAFREARSRAMMRGAAQLVSVQIGGAGATLDIWEGESSSCLLSTFPRDALHHVYASTTLPGNPEVRLENVSPGQNTIELCFTPAGRVLHRFDTTSVLTEDNGVGTGLVLNGGFVYRLTNPLAPDTVARRVFLSLDGVPRLAP
jgi:prepilin-type N-terminal cleavage/methylation domain-containing protein